jgi:transposase
MAARTPIRGDLHASADLRRLARSEPLPPRSPELNPVERPCPFLKQHYLSHRLHEDDAAIVEAVCNAWQRLIADTGRITSLCSHSWIIHCVTS